MSTKQPDPEVQMMFRAAVSASVISVAVIFALCLVPILFGRDVPMTGTFILAGALNFALWSTWAAARKRTPFAGG